MTCFTLSTVYMYALTSQGCFGYENYPVPVISYCKSKRSTQKMSQNQFVFQKDPWEIVACVVFDMHKDTYPLSIFSEQKRRRWRLKCSRNRRCLHEIWCRLILIIDICFFMHPENKACLPLRNYSNDLQQCMFSYSFVAGIWEHILTSQLLMQGSE